MRTPSYRAPTARPRRLVTPVLAAVLVATACNDSTGTGVGSFTATVTGLTNKTYAGEALAASEGGFGYALIMESHASLGPDQFSLFLSRENAARPAVGTYDVVDFEGDVDPTPDQFVGVLDISLQEPNSRSCHTVSGSVTFTGFSGGRAAGTFEIEISCTLDDDPSAPAESATVEGTFDAVTATTL